MSPKNRQILLASRPSGAPTPENFRLVEAEVPRPRPDAAAHGLPLPRPLHAQPHERRTLIRPAGRAGRGHGGRVFDAVLPLLNPFARVPVCGLIAHYNATEPPPGPDRVPALMMAILTKRLTFRGFIVSDFAAQFRQFFADMSAWLKEGRIKYREDITAGPGNAPRELIGLLKGENFSKQIIRVGPAPAGR